MKTLYLAWQAPVNRLWYPVGRLEANPEQSEYIFQYVHGVRDAQQQGFHPLSGFPKLGESYHSSELFPFFRNRVMALHRRSFAEYIASLGMDQNHVDFLDILAVTGGERQTDSFEVFQKPDVGQEGQLRIRFFLHGLKYCNDAARKRRLTLEVGDKLKILVDYQNEADGYALHIATQDNHLIGWLPRYLREDLAKPSTLAEVGLMVVRNNPEGTPLNRKLLLELTAKLPADTQPMSNVHFQPFGNMC